MRVIDSWPRGRARLAPAPTRRPKRGTAFRVVNGAACRPEDARLRAARPKPVRGPRGQRGAPEGRGVRYEDGSIQLELPIDWASLNFPGKEAA